MAMFYELVQTHPAWGTNVLATFLNREAAQRQIDVCKRNGMQGTFKVKKIEMGTK